MNSNNFVEEHEITLTFNEKVDILFNEIDLAIKWSRPSILFAVYSSGSILSKAKAELEDRLTHLNQKTHVIEISGKNQSNFSTEIFQLPRLSHSVLFIDDIKCDCNEENTGFFTELKRNLEKFIDHRIRVVFWLAVDQVPLFAINAVECWILRHHVVEFEDDPLQTKSLMETIESTWQGVDENVFSDPSASNAINEIISYPEKVEADYFHGNLILELGILYWRKGNSKDALKFLNVALDIAKKISNKPLETQCQNALALVKSDPKNSGDTLAAPRQAIPLSSEEEDKCVDPVQPAGPQSIMEQSDRGLKDNVTKSEIHERGVDMKESDHLFDHKTPTEWNELGNKFLRTGSYNDAINAYTKAIELAPDLSWPYIRNLASAHYHKGKIKGKLSNGKTEELDVWEGEDDDMEPIAYFSQENIPAAKRGDDIGDQEVNQKPKKVVTPVEEKVTLPSQGSSSANNPTLLTHTYSGMQLGTNPVTDTPTGKQVKVHQNQNMDSGEPTTIPPGFMPIPKVESTGPQSAFDWNVLGNSYASTQDYDKAINAYKKSIEIDPSFGQAYCNLGSVLYQSGKYESAVLILKKSLDYMVTPEEKSLSWNRLGDVYRRLRDYGNAMAAYQKAGQLNPDTNPVLTRTRLSLMDPVAVG